jgi:8-oxo-dGTP diphosphatase
MEDQRLHPQVGIGVMILKHGKVLLGMRRGSHGAGEFAFPGGHLEYMESFEDCARRETREECGIEIENVRFQFVANIQQYAPKHYVHIGLIADWKGGEPKALEPQKCDGWGWYDLDAVPSESFAAAWLGIAAFKTGRSYYDVDETKKGESVTEE